MKLENVSKFLGPKTCCSKTRISSFEYLFASLLAIACVISTPGDCYAQQESNGKQASSKENGQWPNFRGPSQNGSTAEATPPTSWQKDKNVQWKVDLKGKNNSSPIVWGDKVFVLDAYAVGGNAGGNAEPQQRQGRRRRRGRGRATPKPTRFVTLCFDKSSGKKLWESVAAETTPHEAPHPDHQFASASPITDGKHVYSFFGTRGLFCYDLSGKLVWKKADFGKMRTRAQFGEGSSPTLYGKFLIVPWDHEGQSKLYVLDKKTGKQVWAKDRDEPTNWVTPVVRRFGDKDLVITGGENYIRAYDLKDGKELWKVSGLTSRPISSPVLFGDMAILASSRGGYRVIACKVGGGDSVNRDQRVVWEKSRTGNDVPSLLLSKNRLYILKGSTGILGCYDAKTGEEFYSGQRIPGIRSIYSSPVAAGGFVFLTGRDGTTVVLKDSEDFEVVSTNRLSDPTDATIAVAKKQLFIRSKSRLYCISAK